MANIKKRIWQFQVEQLNICTNTQKRFPLLHINENLMKLSNSFVSSFLLSNYKEEKNTHRFVYIFSSIPVKNKMIINESLHAEVTDLNYGCLRDYRVHKLNTKRSERKIWTEEEKKEKAVYTAIGRFCDYCWKEITTRKAYRKLSDWK